MELFLWYVDIRESFQGNCNVYPTDPSVLEPFFTDSLHNRLVIGGWAGSGSQR